MVHIKNQTTLFLIRHGQTSSNARHIRQGIQINDYLNARGVMEIQHLVPIIEKLDLNILFTSHLHRAEETAALINQTLKEPIQILYDYRLRERDFGSLSGKPIEEWDKLLPDHLEKEKLQIYDYRPFKGENVEAVRFRIFSALLDLTENYDHRNIGLITHGGIIRLILFHFPDIPRIYRQNQDSTEKDISNADIYEWEITDGLKKTFKSLLTK